MVGTTRSRVNAFMNRFKRLGFLETRDGVRYVSPARLRAVHDGSPDAYRLCGAWQAPQAHESHRPAAG